MSEEKIIIYGCKVRLKTQSKLMLFIGWLLKPINPYFISNYFTTLYDTIYVPSSFNINDQIQIEKNKITFQHEKIHIEDMKKYHIWFYFTYLFPPIFIAYGRFYWERRAYLPELLELIDNHQYTLFYYRVEKISKEISGPGYFWAWPQYLCKSWFLKKTGMPEL